MLINAFLLDVWGDFRMFGDLFKQIHSRDHSGPGPFTDIPKTTSMDLLVTLKYSSNEVSMRSSGILWHSTPFTNKTSGDIGRSINGSKQKHPRMGHGRPCSCFFHCL